MIKAFEVASLGADVGAMFGATFLTVGAATMVGATVSFVLMFLEGRSDD